MVDKELGINATAMIDNALTELQNLVSGIQGLPDSTTLTIDVDGNATEVVNAIKADFDSLQDSALVAGDEISNSMDSAANSVQNVGNSAKDAADQTAEIGDQAEETGTKAQDGFGLAEASVVAFMATLELGAQSMNDLNISFDRLSSATLPEGNLRNMVADITDVTMNADEALSYVTTLKRMGLTTEDSLRRGATAMNVLQEGTRGTQEDVQGLVASFRTLGVDVDQLPATYNAVAYANANMANGIKDYNALMGRYAYRFREMGLSADQSAVLLVAAQRKYGPNMRAMYSNLNSLLEESGGNFGYMQEKLGLYNNELVNAGNVTGQYSGKLEQNTAYARDHKTDLQKTGAAVEDVNIKYGDLLSTVMSLGSITLFGGLGAGVGVPAALKGIDKLWDTDLAGRYMGWMKTNFIDPAKGLGGRVLSGVSSIGSDLMERLFPKSIDTTKMFGLEDYAKYYGYAEEGGKNISQGLIDGIKTKGGDIWRFIFGDEAGRFAGELNIGSVIPRSIEEGIMSIPGVIGKGASAIKPLASGALKMLGSSLFAPVTEGLFLPGGLFYEWERGKNPIQFLTEGWDTMIAQESARIGPGLAALKDDLNLPGWIRGHVLPVDWSSLLGVDSLIAGTGEVQAWTGSTWQWIQTLWPQINLNEIDWWSVFGLDWLGPYADMVKLEFDNFILDLWNAPGKLYQVGKAMMANLVQGIIDKFPSLESALAWVSDHFPKSPPKIGPLAAVTPATMADYGRGLSGGMSEGVSEYEAPQIDPAKVMTPLGVSLADWYDGASRQVSKALGDTGGGGYGRSIDQDQSRVRGATSQFGSSRSGKEALNKSDAAAAPSTSQQTGWRNWLNQAAKQAQINAYYASPRTEFIKDPSPLIQARRQAMIASEHLKKYGETMSQAISRARRTYGFMDAKALAPFFPGARKRSTNTGFAHSDAWMEAHSTPVADNLHVDTHQHSGGGNWGSSPSRAGSAAAAAARATTQSPYQTQTIEGQSVVVHINDPVIRSDMDIKTISNELGREIGRKARQNGIGVMIR